MRINWGTSIVIAFALFMSFILYFVIKVQSNSKYDNELVVDEYYKKDAKFGAEMVRVQNAADLSEKPAFTAANGEVSIVFPKIYDSSKITGKVSLYRPSNKKLDFEIPLSLTNSTLLIPKKSLVGGRWDITIDWQYDGKLYTTKEDLYLR
ncbi:MAG: FixH family protein [Flavobacterium sp.]|nr:FixH family protein [Flavobacterium sp.]